MGHLGVLSVGGLGREGFDSVAEQTMRTLEIPIAKAGKVMRYTGPTDLQNVNATNITSQSKRFLVTLYLKGCA